MRRGNRFGTSNTMTYGAIGLVILAVIIYYMYKKSCPDGNELINGKCFPRAQGWYDNTVDLKSKFGAGSKSLQDCFNAPDKPANADLILYRAVNNPDWKDTCAAWTLDGIKSGVFGHQTDTNTSYMACVNGKDPSNKCA